MAFVDAGARRSYQAQWAAEKRLELKTAQKCIDCRADLGDDDGVRCARCDKRDRDGKADRRDARIRRRERKNNNKRRARLQREGKCVTCTRPRGDDGTKYRCRPCQDEANAHTAAYKERKSKELTPREAKAPHSPRGRILRAMRRLEWPTTGELWTALELGDYDADDVELRRDRDRYAKALSREVEAGTVERREVDVGKYVERTYHLTDEGRRVAAELAKRTA